MAAVSVGSGAVVSYMHNATAAGRRGVVARVSAGADVLEPLGKQIAMHIAATAPATCPSTISTRIWSSVSVMS